MSRPQAGREHERARFTVTVPALLAKHLLPTRYTCYGGNESPAIRWGSLPAGTREVVLFVANITPVDGKNQFDWAIAGINPTTHTIAAGRPPAGAVVGRNSFGKTAYTMCVPNGHREENAVVDVFALSHPLAASPGFDAEALWREAARAATAGGVEGWLYTTS